jgi:hypothetical protein
MFEGNALERGMFNEAATVFDFLYPCAKIELQPGDRYLVSH